MTPSQYNSVDLSQHTPDDLTGEIATTLVLFGYGSQHQSRIANWLLHCTNHDEQRAFELARKVTKHLRGANAEVDAMEIHAALSADRAPFLP
ncbi:MAG: hypothetical protein QM740_18120 [Acidovorax sp.]